METWQEWLEYYYKKYNYNFIVQKIDKFPYPWLNYKTPKYNKFISSEKFVSQREVFPDEIVFDIDMEKDLPLSEAKRQSKEIGKVICRRLKDLGYAHSFWMTGGSGCHVHTFFPELANMHPNEARMLKRSLLKEIGHGFIRPRKYQGRVQLQSLTTIQLECAPHRKGGTKSLIVNYETRKPNVLQDSYRKMAEEEKKQNKLFKESQLNTSKNKKPNAILFLETEDFYNLKDGRDRALFVLTAYYKQFLEGDELFATLDAWNQTIMKGYFKGQTIKAKMKSTRPGLNLTYLREMFDEMGLDDRSIERSIVKC